MLKTIVYFYKKCDETIKKGVNVDEIKGLPIYQEIMRMKSRYSEEQIGELEKFTEQIDDAVKDLGV